MEEAFITLMVSLCDFCILHVPVSTDVFELDTDASCLGVGAVLNIVREGETLPMAFFSHQLHGPEKQYSATETEALAVVAAVKHFEHFLFGCSFSVFY